MKDNERKAMFANLSNPKMRTGRTRKNPETVRAKKKRAKTLEKVTEKRFRKNFPEVIKERDNIASMLILNAENIRDADSDDLEQMEIVNERLALAKKLENREYSDISKNDIIHIREVANDVEFPEDFNLNFNIIDRLKNLKSDKIKN